MKIEKIALLGMAFLLSLSVVLASCDDSQKEYNFYEKGVLFYDGEPVFDSCYEDFVYEVYCTEKDTSVFIDVQLCDYGCADEFSCVSEVEIGVSSIISSIKSWIREGGSLSEVLNSIRIWVG